METIQRIATGVVRFEQTEQGLCLQRFSEKQVQAFYESLPYYEGAYFERYFGDNCRTLAGISLDFCTNSRNICLKMSENSIPSDGKPGVFDLYINGIYRQSFPWMPSIDLHLAAGEKRVTIYCPYFNFPAFTGMDCDGDVRPAGQGVDILLLGDSITHGVGAFNPGSSYANTLARTLNVRILNQGQSGYVYDAKTIDKVCEPKLIVCAYGTNDASRKPPQKITDETDAFFTALKQTYPGVPVAAILPPWSAYAGEKAKQARGLLQEVYAAHGLTVFDGRKMIPHDAAYFADGLHPNNYGGRIYGKRLAAALKSVDKFEGLW